MPHNTKDFDFPLLKSDVTQIVQETVLSTLEGNAYDHKKVNDWTTTVAASCVDDLQKLSMNFKYIVTCFVRQRKGAGLELHSSSYWDEKTDGACIVSWENPTMSVVVSVYGIAITSSS
uniref:Dynein light chain Tctex-type n=1 Tax=Globisporangium ultimum (strain ATCC 200006 / CBS 805.95 / DAOM BR144) TaxID=431595 RepID=K3WI80_GLOUD